jgi:hypothetical protein
VVGGYCLYYIPQFAWQSYCGVPGACRRRRAAVSGYESEAAAVAVAVTMATRVRRAERMVIVKASTI